MTTEEMIEKAKDYIIKHDAPKCTCEDCVPEFYARAKFMADFAMSVIEDREKSDLPKWMTKEQFQTVKDIYSEEGTLPSVKYLYELANPHHTAALQWSKAFFDIKIKNSTK